MRCVIRVCLLLATLVACRAPGPGLPPATVGDLPWGSAPAGRIAWSARQAVERGDVVEGLAQVEALLGQRPLDVDARRLRQDVLRQRGRRGLLVREARAAVEARPEDGLAHYLLARVTEDRAEKLAGFRRAARLAPAEVWPWLGLAHTLRASDLREALRVYERLFAASDQHPMVAVAYASALRQADRSDEAALVYRAIQDDPRVPGVGALGLAEVALTRNQRGEAWEALIEALRARPFDPGVQRLVRGWLDRFATRDQRRQVVDVLRADPAGLRAFCADDAVVAELLLETGQLQAAQALLGEQLSRRPSPALKRARRRLALGAGDVAAFVRHLRADVPRHVVDVEDNELRGRWRALLDGPWTRGAPLADAPRSLALLTALRDCGMLVEVELIAELACSRHPTHAAALREVQAEVRRELAFEAGLRRMLYRGYRSGDTAALPEVVERARALSVEILGRDCVGAPSMFTAPLVGEMLDPFAGSGLCAHLATYNRHLVLGRRSGGTAEGLMVTRLSVRELPDVARQSLPNRCFEVVGMDRQIRALGGVLGGDLAGVALLDHFLIDHDAVDDWALGLLERRRIARQDDLALAQDLVPADVGLDPLDVAWRLTLRSPVPDGELAVAVLEMIRAHERRHLVDSSHYLPIEANLLRGAGLLFRFGASPAAIEAEMERRAELAALALSPFTELVLAHIADFYGDPPLRSPHHVGFSELLQELCDELVAAGVPAPRAVPSRLHELEMVEVRAAAGRLLDRIPGGR